MATKKKSELVFKNKRVYFDYEVIDKIESGIVLCGTEVKSIRYSKISLNGSFCVFNDGELFIKGMDIATYKEGSYNNHEPKRDRKLLLHKKQLRRLQAAIEEKGMTVVPIKLYANEKGVFKLEIGLGKGRKKADKRSYIAERDEKKNIKKEYNINI